MDEQLLQQNNTDESLKRRKKKSANSKFDAFLSFRWLISSFYMILCMHKLIFYNIILFGFI